MTALLKYLDILLDSWEARLLHAKTNPQSKPSCKCLVSTYIDKQLVCKLSLFTTAGPNSTSISSWRIQIGFVHKHLWQNYDK